MTGIQRSYVLLVKRYYEKSEGRIQNSELI